MTAADDARIEFAIDLARRAGRLGAGYFAAIDTLTIESKGHQDLVSNADKEVEAFVRREIGETFPLDGIVGEEDAPHVGTSGFTWVIDPIDGTGNFVRGIPSWCVAIAVVRNGAAEIGVICDPVANETFHAVRGRGAFLNGKAMRTAGATRITDGTVGVGFSNRANTAHVASLVTAILARGGVFYRNGSGALMLAYVAAGRLLAYCEEHMNAWDCLAGLLMIEEAGGRIHAPNPATAVADGTRVIGAGMGFYPEIEALADAAFNG
jgi:myo-inositol-1(or 4)-monophosphatase